MLCASLLDCLAPGKLEEKLNLLRDTKITVNTEKTCSGGISGTKVSFEVEGSAPPADFEGIKKLIDESSLEKEISRKVIETYTEIFRAEAAVHGIAPEKVKLHELAAPRKIAEITAFHVMTAGREIFFSVPVLGCGTTGSAHGKIPLPSPATAEILKGIPVSFTDSEKEMVTPSAAALLKVSGKPVRPDMVISSIGYGIGKTSILRAFAGKRIISAESGITELEFNVDDMTPEDISFFTEKISSVAVDCWVTPVIMKKSRPGHMVTVLTEDEKLGVVQDMIFEHTSTSGIRLKRTGRAVLKRDIVNIDTPLGRCRIKKYTLPSGKVRVKPEYEDLKLLAEKNSISVALAREKVIMEYSDI